VTSPDAKHLLTTLETTKNTLSTLENLQIAIAIGSEGGWTNREEAMAIASGFIPVSLGDRILSAVTAPVVALAIIAAFLESI
jgi:16S rRNA (uracil1498-N3)-methyltransferase